MKKIVVAVVVAAMSVGAFAAQCKGLTQKGERCKREPAEGSEYCIGHADQAKSKQTESAKPAAKDAPKSAQKPAAKPADKGAGAAKEQDDGTCWAMTESGTRCKRRKDGESDYCKQHAPDVKPSKPLDRCRAVTYDGTQCVRKPVEGGRYCKQHSK